MVYQEYLGAANRHLSACKLMLKTLNTISDQKREESRCLRYDIYYLSGYVIETLISYSFFNYLGLTKNEKIENNAHYNKGFKQHRIAAKLHYVNTNNCYFNGVTLLDKECDDKLMTKMMYEWNENVRYQQPNKISLNFDFTNQQLEKYISLIEKMKNEILKLYFS